MPSTGSRFRFRDLPDYAARLIRFKAQKLVGWYGLSPSDREDIEQHLVEFLWPRLGRFDPEKGELKPFIDNVIKKGIGRLVEHRRAGKRDYRRERGSINDPVRDADGRETQRSELIDENEGARRLGRGRAHFTDRADLDLDLTQVASKLPPELRELCEQLRSKSLTEISHETGVPRGTLYERRRQLQRLFEDAGLREYLDEA